MVKKHRLTRFSCGHCGNRLVMHDRHLDRLVACHACGRATHPVAGRLAGPPAAAAPAPVGRKPAARSASPRAGRPAAATTTTTTTTTAAAAALRACANCGETIGKLQARRAWQSQTVCQPCHAKLAAEAALPTPAPSAATPQSRQQHAPASKQLAKRAQPAEAALPATRDASMPSPVSRPARVTRVVGGRVPDAAAAGVPMLELSAAPLAPVLLVGVTCAGFFFALSLMSYVGGFVSALLLVCGAAAGLRWLRRWTSSVRARFDHLSAVRRQYGSSRVVAMLAAWLGAQPAARLPYAFLLLVLWGAMYVPYRLGSLLTTARAVSPARAAA